MLHVTDAKYIGQYKIEVHFNNGNSGVVDLSDALIGPVFEPLQDQKVFSRFTLNSTINTLCWQNGADFAPEFLYYKAFQHKPELQNQFKNWGYLK